MGASSQGVGFNSSRPAGGVVLLKEGQICSRSCKNGAPERQIGDRGYKNGAQRGKSVIGVAKMVPERHICDMGLQNWGCDGCE